MLRIFAIAVAFHTCITVPLFAADEWGDLTLRIVYDSDRLPKPKPVEGVAGVMFCGDLKLKTDDLLVNLSLIHI